MTSDVHTRISPAEVAELVAIEERLATLSVEARHVADACGLNRREIAMRMGNASPSTLQRLMKGMAYNATLDTMARFAWACGYEFQVSLVPKAEARSNHCEDRRSEGPNVFRLDDYARASRRMTGTWTGISESANRPEFDPPQCRQGPARWTRSVNG